MLFLYTLTFSSGFNLHFFVQSHIPHFHHPSSIHPILPSIHPSIHSSILHNLHHRLYRHVIILPNPFVFVPRSPVRFARLLLLSAIPLGSTDRWRHVSALADENRIPQQHGHLAETKGNSGEWNRDYVQPQDIRLLQRTRPDSADRSGAVFSPGHRPQDRLHLRGARWQISSTADHKQVRRNEYLRHHFIYAYYDLIRLFFTNKLH